MAAPEIQFADLSNPQLHQLAGLMGAVHGGLARAQMMTNMEAINQLVVDHGAVRVLPAPLLRNLAQAQGLDDSGTRAHIARRLANQASPPVVLPHNPNVDPLPNPRDIVIRNLPHTMDHVLHREWEAEIKSSMMARQCWAGILEDLLLNNNPILNPRQEQTLELLKSGLKRSLGESVMSRLSPEIAATTVPDTAAGIILWIRAQVTALGTAIERKAKAELTSTKWKDSKCDLLSWVGKLRSIASKCGPTLPPGVA